MPQPSLSTRIHNSLNSGTAITESVTSSENHEMQLVEIGKPYGFRPEVDATRSVRSLLEKKMGVVDLIPCGWQFPVTELEVGFQSLQPKIYFDEPIQEYKRACALYHLKSDYNGARLYLTDNTASTDDVVSTYDQNVFESAIDSMRNNFRSFAVMRKGGTITQSIDSNANNAFGKIFNDLEDKVRQELADRFGYDIKGSDKSPQNSLLQSIGSLVMMGNKISFPKIWRDSAYDPHLNINVRLFSPYGHPEAITKFIIRPLMHLLLLCAPKTNDGMTYGHPNPLHIRGYGLVHLPLAYPSQISWRRGGDDSSYNIYRQPLTIDVSMTFHALIGGFAYFNNDSLPDNETHMAWASQSMEEKVFGARKVSFPTLGHMIDSLRPFKFKDATTPSPKPPDPSSFDMMVPTNFAKSLLRMGGIPTTHISLLESILNNAQQNGKQATEQLVKQFLQKIGY